MSFWNLNDTTETIDTSGSFEAQTSMEPIPAKTQVKAACDEAKWDTYDGDEYISLRWNILAPAEYKGRKVFQKVRVKESDAKKADKAKKMLGAIAVNAGGGLLKLQSEPTDQDLQKHLLNKPMALLLAVWEIDDKKGNWISAVSPLKSKAKESEPVIEEDDDEEF